MSFGFPTPDEQTGGVESYPSDMSDIPHISDTVIPDEPLSEGSADRAVVPPGYGEQGEVLDDPEPAEHLGSLMAQQTVEQPDRAPVKEHRTDTQTHFVSTRHPDPAAVSAAEAALADGVPDEWTAHSNPGSTTEQYIDNPEHPTIVVTAHDASDSEDVPELLKTDSPEQRMKVAAAVTEALDDPAIQDVAIKSRYAGISIIEPLLSGTSDAGEQYTAYPYVEGRVPTASRSDLDLMIDADDDSRAMRDAQHESMMISYVASQVDMHLASHGIDTAHLTEKDMLITTDDEGNKHLRIIDVSNYRLMPQVPETHDAPLADTQDNARTLWVSSNESNQALAEYAANALENGIPSAWPPVDTASNSPVFRDTVDNPTIFVKVLRDSPSVAGTNMPVEMDTAPRVQALLASDYIQQSVQAQGFSGVSLVQPLVARIDHTSGERLVAYPWQQGYTHSGEFAVDAPDPELEGHRLQAVADTIERFFKANGIRPVDFDLLNFKLTPGADGRPHLHLFDITEFKRLQGGAS